MKQKGKRRCIVSTCTLCLGKKEPLAISVGGSFFSGHNVHELNLKFEILVFLVNC